MRPQDLQLAWGDLIKKATNYFQYQISVGNFFIYCLLTQCYIHFHHLSLFSGSGENCFGTKYLHIILWRIIDLAWESPALGLGIWLSGRALSARPWVRSPAPKKKKKKKNRESPALVMGYLACVAEVPATFETDILNHWGLIGNIKLWYQLYFRAMTGAG